MNRPCIYSFKSKFFEEATINEKALILKAMELFTYLLLFANE
jgi:hypothetical protein